LRALARAVDENDLARGAADDRRERASSSDRSGADDADPSWANPCSPASGCQCTFAIAVPGESGLHIVATSATDLGQQVEPFLANVAVRASGGISLKF
jgi:hypothetical protein